jgi:hypothetical protein
MKIRIVGGGSTGWMTAAYLKTQHPEYDILVLEDKNIPPTGVGEATTPYLMRFFKSVGVETEQEWMSKCNAVYKNGVLYQDWNNLGSSFWHAFEVDENKYTYWNKKRMEEGLSNEDYWHSSMFTGQLGIRDSSKWLADETGEVVIPYYHTKAWNGWPQHWAYHVDATLFGKYLREIALEKGVLWRDDFRVVDAKLDEEGNIKSIISSENEKIEGDLFIDASGFKRVLISKVAEVPFKSFNPYLTHNKACVIRRDYIDPDSEMKARTGSKALSSGWMWDIPMYHTQSFGYVYTSDFISDDQAEKEMRDAIGFERTKNVDSFTVDIKSGYYPKPWSKNVVAIGLAAGFIEPLEATLLLAVQAFGIRVSEVLNGEATKEEFNSLADTGINDFLDYISLGYRLTHRNDSEFWRSRGKNTVLSDRMEEWLERCKYELVPPEDIRWFVPSSWISKLIGFGYYPTEDKTKYRDVDQMLAERQMQEVKNFDWHKLLSQKEFLDKFRY